MVNHSAGNTYERQPGPDETTPLNHSRPIVGIAETKMDNETKRVLIKVAFDVVLLASGESR